MIIQYKHGWDLACKIVSVLILLPPVFVLMIWLMPIFEKYGSRWHLPEIVYWIPIICVLLPFIILIHKTPLASKLPTYLYVRISLATPISWKDTSRFVSLFETDSSGKWHPLSDTKLLPIEYRIMVLDELLESFAEIFSKGIESLDPETSGFGDLFNVVFETNHNQFDKVIPVIMKRNRIKEGNQDGLVAISYNILNLPSGSDLKSITTSYHQLRNKMVTSSKSILDPIIQSFILCRMEELNDAYSILSSSKAVM